MDGGEKEGERTFVVDVEVLDGAPVQSKIFERRLEGGGQHLPDRTEETAHHVCRYLDLNFSRIDDEQL